MIQGSLCMHPPALGGACHLCVHAQVTLYNLLPSKWEPQHHVCVECGAKDTVWILLYSKEYNFPILL